MSTPKPRLRRCRVCLHGSTAKKEIFVNLMDQELESSERDAPEEFNYLQSFNTCTQLQLTLQQLREEIETGGEYSVCHYLCRNCSEELMRAHEFIRQACANHEWLQEQVQLKLGGAKDTTKEEPPDDFTDLLQILQDEDDSNHELERNVADEFKQHDYDAFNDGDPVEEYLIESESEDPDPLIAQRGEQLVDFAVETIYDGSVEEHASEDCLETNDVDVKVEKSLSLGEESNISMELADVDSDWEVQAVVEQEHKKYFQFNCELCTDKFKYQCDLMEHHQQDHDPASLPFSCNVCSNRFASKDTLRIHVRRVHEQCEYRDCEHCGRSVLASFHKLHLKRHSQQLKFPCSMCPNTYNSKYTLNNHMKLHSTNHNRKHKCDDCGRKFYKLENMRVHRLTHQDPKERPRYSCTICAKTFLRQSNLRLHMQMHRGETFDCEYCGKKFVRHKDFEIHIRFHTGDFPYMCHVCGRKFAIQSHLKYHEERHLGVRYQCSYCDKAFINLSGLHQHTFRHTGMPYSCNICSRGFPTKFKMRRHLRSVHHSVFANNGGYSDAASNQYITEKKMPRVKVKRQYVKAEKEENLNEEFLDVEDGEEELTEDALSI